MKKTIYTLQYNAMQCRAIGLQCTTRQFNTIQNNTV